MEVALLIGSLGILGVAANLWGVDSRDSDVSLFKCPCPPARETLLAWNEATPGPAVAIPCSRPRAHLRLRLHRA